MKEPLEKRRKRNLGVCTIAAKLSSWQSMDGAVLEKLFLSMRP